LQSYCACAKVSIKSYTEDYNKKLLHYDLNAAETQYSNCVLIGRPATDLEHNVTHFKLGKNRKLGILPKTRNQQLNRIRLIWILQLFNTGTH